MQNDISTSTTAVRPNEWNAILSAHPQSLSVATFNTLRRNYSFEKKYWVPNCTREWHARQSIHKTLLSSLGTDVICLQEAEVPTFDEDFGFTKELGYDAVKPTAKKGEHGHTKPSILYKASRLVLKWQNARTRTLLVLFEDIVTGKLFYVINCHLQGGAGQEDQRCFQVRSALQQLQNHVKTSKVAIEDVICFLCGDFNETLVSPLHTLIKEGQPNAQEIEKYFKGKPFNFSHAFGFLDSHVHVTDRPFTFKWGVKDDAIYQFIDYIYFTQQMVEVQCVRRPLLEEHEGPMRETLGIPNSWNPSDHLPTAVLFKFK